MFKNSPGLGVAGLESGPSTWVDGAGKGTHAESVISGSSEGKAEIRLLRDDYKLEKHMLDGYRNILVSQEGDLKQGKEVKRGTGRSSRRVKVW